MADGSGVLCGVRQGVLRCYDTSTPTDAAAAIASITSGDVCGEGG